MTVTQKAEALLTEALKATPPSTVAAIGLFGVPLATWATILSIVVLLLQAYFLIRNNTGGKKNGNTQDQSGVGDSRSGASRSESDPGV